MTGLRELIKASSVGKKLEYKKVSPTLLIGLGGTGKEVLLRLRRRLVTTYGSLDELPFLRFLHCDTDQTRKAREQYDVKQEDDPLWDSVRFRGSEIVNLSIDGGTSRYLDNLGKYPRIARWFPGGDLQKLGDLGEGAGQIRAAGRLTMFHRQTWDDLRGRIEQALDTLRNPDVLTRVDGGFDVDTGELEFVVVASIAGGTGSGTFLDFGYLLKDIAPADRQFGIFFMPGFYKAYGGADRTRANGYAALMELNHYSFGNRFMRDWDGNARTMAPPPYSNIYLLDSANAQGVTVGSGGNEYGAYEMVSDFLFHDYSSGAFAGSKRAARVNLMQYNLAVFSHNYIGEGEVGPNEDALAGDAYPCRFGSFGLARISFPTEAAQSVAAARLSRNVLESWQREELTDPQEELFTRFLCRQDIRFAQGELVRRDGVEVDQHHIDEALLVYSEESGATFASEIWKRARELRMTLENNARKEKGSAFDRERKRLDDLFSGADSEGSDQWGQWVRMIDENARRYGERVRQGLTDGARDIANNSQRGVLEATSLLRELKKLLRNENFDYFDYFNGEAEEWRDAAEEYGFEMDRLGLEIRQHEHAFLFRRADLARDMRWVAADEQSDSFQGIVYRYYFARVMRQVVRRGRWICAEIDTFLGDDSASGKGLIGHYFRLLSGVFQVENRAKQRERYFQKPVSNQFTMSLYRDGDFDQWYENWVGTGSSEKAVVKSVGAQILQEVFKTDSVSAVIEALRRSTPEEIERRMFEICRNYIRSIDEQPDALEMLLDSDRADALGGPEKAVGSALKLAHAWLKKGDRGLGHIDYSGPKSDQRPFIVGRHAADRRHVEKLRRLVEESMPGDLKLGFEDLGELHRGEIVFYQELAGVPVFYSESVTALQGLRETYHGYAAKEELHTERDRYRFGDLVPKTQSEIERYLEALRAIVLGRALGLLTVERRQALTGGVTVEAYEYRRRDIVDQVKHVYLGSEEDAIDLLYRQATDPMNSDREELLRQIDEKITAVKTARQLHVYLLFLDYYMNCVYAPHVDTESVAGHKVETYPPQHLVLTQAKADLSRYTTDEELELIKSELTRLKGGDDVRLSYEDYMRVLEPFGQEAGTYEVFEDSHARRGRSRRAVTLALRLKNLRRSCPVCGDQIDIRAGRCSHCKADLGSPAVCPNPSCSEANVPRDLSRCWRCDAPMPGYEETVQCGACFDFWGRASENPSCPKCGEPLKAPASGGSQYAEAPRSGDEGSQAETEREWKDDDNWEPMSEQQEKAGSSGVGSGTDSDEESARDGAGVGSGEQAKQRAAPSSGEPPLDPVAKEKLVECPHCFEMVSAGEICSECYGDL